MRADVSLRGAAYAAAPLALAAGWLDARARGAPASRHDHARPLGRSRRCHAAAAAAPALPLVVSLHGSDVYVAETFAPARVAARAAFRRAGFVTACSDDLARRAIALGADRGADRDGAVRRRRRTLHARRLGARRCGAQELGVGARRAALSSRRAASCARRGSSISSTRWPRVPGAVLAIAGDGTLARRAARARPRRRRRRDGCGSSATRRRTAWASTSRRPTWSACRRSATTAATSTDCRMSCWRRWRRGRRSSRRRPAASASVVERRRHRARRCRNAMWRRSRSALSADRAIPRRGRAMGDSGRALVEARFRLGAAPRSGSRPLTPGRLPSSRWRELRFTAHPCRSLPPRSQGSVCSFPPTTTAGRSPAWSSPRCTGRARADVGLRGDHRQRRQRRLRPRRSPTSWRGTYPEVRVVHHARNRGYGGALRSGFEAATRDLVFYTDGDAQYDPTEMAVLWARARRRRRPRQRLQDQPVGPVASDRDRTHLSSHGEAAVRVEGARRRLRLPAVAPVDLRTGARSKRAAASSASR